MATQQTSASPQKPNLSTAFAKVSGTLKSLNFSSADEVREFPNGRLELVRFGEAVVGRAILQPGWRWSKSVKEIAQTDSCEAPHFQYHVSGILRIKMDDGTEIDCKPGDVSLVPPGHDAWVVGDEPVVIVDFQGMVDYAIQAHKH
ncbi:hypothetical protein Bb109J_c0401 [Bdellovibrio bacteriovorus]|uniref:cupin domain-containing protein n=1 Tax=Bdellovibrio bacteriovorus TaxID=959 RepID=UPI00045BEAD4|nr:cupin domain-containing protein [Bdellovibrio bacteriovorus]AHZ86056.1 cupin [Bdellovibrio bacteriovorus]BEV66981.1 hypothetical protein Bb109J_c0401 [Bdellovibrio bacteriovorus]